ncbi:MAG: hypothetical protein ABIT05_16780 [Chitinophagaceae bacterium]
MYVQPFTEGNYFHIYNRGVNGEDIFKETKNYYYFLQQYKTYCSPVLETLAYCLLKNHFHFLVYVKENVEVPRKDRNGLFKMNASKQLGHFFNSYAQAINKSYNRTGPLFESPFERILVQNEDYLMRMIHYCNLNAPLHRFVSNPGEWEFSSYGDTVRNDSSLVAAEKVIYRFGGVDQFEHSHQLYLEQKKSETETLTGL